jgi:glycerophosphoryl diester phosphodiesterase
MPFRPLLLGHRGARGKRSVSENTLASFDFALTAGCDGFEFDVRLSADRQPVLCHDAKSQRLTVAKCSAEQLALPLLSVILQRYKHSAFLDIELKVLGLETIVSDLLCLYPPQQGFVISSFIPEVLLTLHQINPTAPLGLICDTRSQLSPLGTLPVNYVMLHHRLAKLPAITQMRSAGKKIIVWTVNSSREIQRFKQWKLDGIISDYPDRLVADESSGE